MTYAINDILLFDWLQKQKSLEFELKAIYFTKN